METKTFPCSSEGMVAAQGFLECQCDEPKPAIILDEIDTGISGEAASKVASKIAEISLSTQVIAISHTPQVAARSDHHLLIEKSVSKGRTSAHVKVLGHEEKIKAIATLIAGKNPTEKQMEAARDMVLSMR